ncbi:hypothetical protein [Sphingomonas sp. LaA6.9]|uniref:hypothetical protein n=1 Tax=Sphingomonas sp. LaA6.9 TaxID=2919914 RepID=UPI001F4F7117|nr:hypothetical protein [Sphingomonas sp. LaA6.9]MCJ8156836.1 hypothetical protein [Sphingomonas sp. LaA6.9]
MIRLVAPAILLALVPLGAAHAQERERINQIVVYGDDPCPASSADEIVVCARKGENERFRIPENLRGNPNDPARDSWANHAERLEYVGRTGIGSCSTAGSGGASGCFNQIMRQAREELAYGDGTNWTGLVEAAREERLSRIDAETARIEAQIKAEEAAKAPQ